MSENFSRICSTWSEQEAVTFDSHNSCMHAHVTCFGEGWRDEVYFSMGPILWGICGVEGCYRLTFNELEAGRRQ